MDDITCVYYTANVISDYFAGNTRKQLLEAIGDMPIISVSHKPMSIGENIVVDLPRHHLSIYKQALIGAKNAKTKYIAMAEDDVLYSREHFKHRPEPSKFAYNVNYWSMYTWVKPPMFTYKGRRNLCNLICERELFIEAMEERFTKHPDGNVNLGNWAEPGKYEKNLGVTIRETEQFYTHPSNIMFSHETALSYLNQGQRKRLGILLAYDIPYWGHADEVMRLYAKD